MKSKCIRVLVVLYIYIFFRYSFLTSFGVYFLIGVAYRRLIGGAKGLEQIPHHNFWKKLGNLQAVCWYYKLPERKLTFLNFIISVTSS
jgi:hypothetical protein